MRITVVSYSIMPFSNTSLIAMPVPKLRNLFERRYFSLKLLKIREIAEVKRSFAEIFIFAKLYRF